jgi:hypothetical protein
VRKKQRVPDIHFYEWSVIRWLTSDTRAKLDPAGRGIFRELLDLCYTQGSIPKDPDLICRKTDCTEEQYRRSWPVMEHHFRQHPHDENLLVNDAACVYRKQYFSYLVHQKRNGSTGGRSNGKDKPLTVREMKTTGLTTGVTTGVSQEEKRREEIRREETTTTTPQSPFDAKVYAESEWPESAEFICSEFPTTDGPLVRAIITDACQCSADEGLNITDGILLQALQTARKQARDQHSAVLYRTTVPVVIRNWAREAKRRKQQ